MSQFDIMNGVVDEICKSLVEEPHRWEFSSFTFKHKRAKVEYWGDMSSPSITHVWTGHTRNRVFSDEQGRKIAEAYKNARNQQADVDQQKVISAMSKLKSNKKRWWIF
jgi:hypothetical protein